jgi:hypothetical protein
MKALTWLSGAFLIPIIVAIQNGSTFTFAFSVAGAGLVLYFVNGGLTGWYTHKKAPETLVDNTWEGAAGTGIVPSWVSVIGMLAVGFAPSGLIVALLLWLGIVVDRS